MLRHEIGYNLQANSVFRLDGTIVTTNCAHTELIQLVG